MSEHSTGQESWGDTQGHGSVSTKFYTWIWLWLVVITALEVWLAYIHLAPATMLVLLLGMSVVKAGLIMSYFMHLRFERFALVLWLIPALIFCIGMMTVFFPDAEILRQLRE